MHLKSASSWRCSVGNKGTRDKKTSSEKMLPPYALCWLAHVMLSHSAAYSNNTIIK